jgi:hypothetical protein
MTCSECGSEGVMFLGIWYDQIEEKLWVLKSHYGCDSCKCATTRPVSEDSFYYRKSTGEIIMRPTYNPARNETRLFIVDVDPGQRWKMDRVIPIVAKPGGSELGTHPSMRMP